VVSKFEKNVLKYTKISKKFNSIRTDVTMDILK